MTAPYKLTPMHHWHERHGAQMTEVAGWKRVIAYGDAKAEMEASRSSVGICDATPLSKIDVQGKHSEQLLVKLLGTAMPASGACISALVYHQTGAARACVARLTADRFVVLGGPEDRARLFSQLGEAVSERGCMHVTDVTSECAVIHLVGPMMTELLKKLGPVQVSALRPGSCVATAMARVWSLVIRRDIGQLPACLVLVARDYGEYVWECIVSAGHEFRIRPFGTVAEQMMADMEASDVAAV